MWNFVSGLKARLALSAETKLHIQKCNTCRDILLVRWKKDARTSIFLNLVQLRITREASSRIYVILALHF
jgi:hypothetical protein